MTRGRSRSERPRDVGGNELLAGHCVHCKGCGYGIGRIVPGAVESHCGIELCQALEPGLAVSVVSKNSVSDSDKGGNLIAFKRISGNAITFAEVS